MALTQRLEFRQSQSLVMTPQLMQAIKLLQLSNLDLSAFVEEELERNPLLERESDGPEAPVAGEPAVGHAEGSESSFSEEFSGDSQGSGAEGFEPAQEEWLNRDLGSRTEIEQTLDTPLDNVFSEEPAEAAARNAQDAAPTTYTEWGGGASNDDSYNLEAFAAAEVTLGGHLAEQLAVAFTAPAQRMIGQYLIDLVDEIAYNTADLDDGYEARLITVEQLTDSVDLFARHYREARSRYPNVAEKLVFNEALKSILDGFVGDLITNTAERVKASGVHSVEDVRRLGERLAAFSPPVEEQRRRLKDFLYENLYYSPALASEKEDAERITGELFAHWMEEPDDLPRNYREKAVHEPLPRVICDYIAGMTDPFIYQQYEKYCST